MSPFEHSRTALSDGQTFGVWSLIVTFFGDMAQGPDDKVSGASLTAVCDKLGIKAQAMRVALHRLRKDGWIDSIKTGRRSAYFLTEASRLESAKASARIYADAAPEFRGFDILFVPTESSVTPNQNSWISVGSENYLSFQIGSIPPEKAIVTHHEGPVPEWLCRRLVCEDIIIGYQDLNRRLASVGTDHWDHLSQLEIAALRVLLVHEWRRLVLKHSSLPAEAFPIDCQATECQGHVVRLLKHLPRPDLTSLG